jgi:hypothetical protein
VEEVKVEEDIQINVDRSADFENLEESNEIE